MPQRKKQVSKKRQATEYEKAKRIYEIANLRLSGRPTDAIEKIIRAKYNISNSVLREDIGEALQKVKNFLDKDLLNIRVQHARRYEVFYEWFKSHEMYSQAFDCLYLIERLVGLHSSKITFSIEQIINKRKAEVDPYDYSRLSDDEIERLKILYEKVRLKPKRID